MADNTIDTLSIRINSTSQGVTKSVNSVIGSLEKLSGTLSQLSSASFNFKNVETGINQLNVSLNKLDTQSITNASAAIRSLSGATASLNRSMSSVNTNAFSALTAGLQGLFGVASVIPDLSGLTNLTATISKLGGKNSTQGVANLSALAGGLRSLSGLSVPDIQNTEGLANLIAIFSKLGGKRGTGASANIRPMVDGLKELSRLSGANFPDASSLMALANAFSALGRSTTATAITNIPQLATAFRDLMITLSTAPTVSRSVIDLANALANLASQGGKVGTATDSMNRQINRMSSMLTGFYGKYRSTQGQIIQFGRNLLTSARNAGSAGRSYSNLASKIGLLYAKFWLLLRAFRVLGKAINIASALTEVQNVVDTTFGNMTYKIEEFSKNAIKNFGMSELSAKQLASRFQAMGNAMGITGQQVAKAQQLINTKKTADGMIAGYNQASNSVADLSINLTKLAGDMASFYDVEQETVGKALQSGVMAGQTRPLRQYGIDLTNATLSEWAMNNGLNANIKAMSQAEKTMLRYQYVMSQTTNAQGDFTRTANTWHNSVVVLKQQLQQLAAVIGSGLIQALKPFVNAMNNALSGLITFAKNVVNALGKIFGWEMEVNTSGLQMDDDAYDVDTSGLDDVADKAGKAGKATDGAAKSAKKLKEQLQGFDKLNVIRSEDSTSGSGGSGGGGGGGGGSGSGGGGGTSGGDVSASLKKTKGMFESEIDNLFDLGRYISDALSDQMEKIKWNDVYAKAREFGTGLAEFLNGLITPRLFADVGRTIANSLNTAFEFLNSFGTEFDWSNFGYSIGIGINAHLRSYNWGTILNAAKVWGKGLASTINKAISTTSFALVGKTLALQLRTAFTFLYNLGNDIEWKTVGESLAQGINSFIQNFPASQFANTIDAWVQGIGTLIGNAIKNIDKATLIQKIKEFWSSLDPGTLSLVLKTLALVKGASFALTIGSTLLNAICQEFVKRLAARLVVVMSGSAVLKGAIGSGLGSAASGGGAMLGNALVGGGLLSSLATLVGAIGGVVLAAKGLFDMWKKGWSASKGVTVAAGTGISLAALGIAGVLTGPLALAIVGITAAFTLFAANHKKITAGLSKNWSDFKKSLDGTAKGLDGPVSYADAKFKEMKNSGISNTDEERKRIDSNYRSIKNSVTNNSTSAAKTSNSKFKDMNTQGTSETKTLGSNVTKTWGTMNKDASTKLGAKGLQGTVKTNMGNARSSGYNAIKGISGDVNGIWSGLGKDASKKINGDGKDTVRSKVVGAFKDVKNDVKKEFPFSLGRVVKDIQLPVIKVTKREQNGVKTPTLDVTRKTVSNYAKAYNTPWMFTRPTLIPTLNGDKVFGDRNGGEIVYGHQSLMDDIASASGASEMSAIGNRQLANDQRIIQLLTVIAEKEFGISQDAVFKAVRKGASDYSMRTGRGAFEF